MKIIFLCGSLKPGHDGVGDYTRRLAGEIIKKGHTATITAFYDRHATEVVKESQTTDNIEIETLRIPFNFNDKERFDIVEKQINNFNPDWISLQYVCYSFNDKGLPWKLNRSIIKTGKGRNWQIMFHELWLGMEINTPVKNSFWGFFQRFLIIRLIKKLQPQIIHTQTSLYQGQLEKHGFSAEQLRLFSNVPVCQVKKIQVDRLLQKGKDFVLAIFGNIHYGAPAKVFIDELASIQTKANLKISFIFIGRCGNALTEWTTHCESNNINYKILGEQSPENISKLLVESSLGITTTPFILVDKSGTVAAMREHNLPIMCVAREWKPKDKFSSKPNIDVKEYQPGNLFNQLSENFNPPPVIDINYIATQFLQSLTK